MRGNVQKLLQGLSVTLVIAVLAGCVDRQVEAPRLTGSPEPVTPTGTPEPEVAMYRQPFDGSPDQPDSLRPTNWDVTIHSRDSATWQQLEPMEAAHSADCGPPPATHPITDYADAVYQCKDHLMTAINASGYGVIYLTPGQLVDFSEGLAVVQFDVSTLRTSTRDWIDLWITPYAENLQLPLRDWGPDLSGEPRNAVQIRMEKGDDKTIFKANVIRDFESTEIEGNWWTGYEEFFTPSAKRRDTFQLRISKTHIKFGLPAHDFWWVDTDIPELSWEQGVVQLGHHSYNPTKDCTDCAPNTWHWDNLVILPTVPFGIIPANRRFADETDAGVTFAQPAPDDAHLRFAGIGENLEVSFDNGATWQTAQLQDQERIEEGHFRSYWMPIPSGVEQVAFRGESWWGGGWYVRDLSLWTPPAQEH